MLPKHLKTGNNADDVVNELEWFKLDFTRRALSNGPEDCRAPTDCDPVECSGIGYAIAEALAREGAHVILNGRSEKNLDVATHRLQKAVDGAACEAVVADASALIRTMQDMKAVISETAEKPIIVDILMPPIRVTLQPRRG